MTNIEVSIRASYPQDGSYNWESRVTSFREIGSVELAFHLPGRFLSEVELSEVLLPLDRHQIRVSSIHMAHARITEKGEFLSTFCKTTKMAKALGCAKIVVHPSRGVLNNNIDKFITSILDPLLQAENVYILWETFSSQRRFLSGIEEIASFCRHKANHYACYDFTHIHKPQEEVEEEVGLFLDQIKSFHVSNRCGRQQHLPVFSQEGDLDFHRIIGMLKREGFVGTLVLEYMPQFHDRLGEDALLLRDLVERVNERP